MDASWARRHALCSIVLNKRKLFDAREVGVRRKPLRPSLVIIETTTLSVAASSVSLCFVSN